MQEIVHCYASQNASSRVIPFLPRVEEVVGRFAILEKGNCNLLTQNNPCYFRFSFLFFLICYSVLLFFRMDTADSSQLYFIIFTSTILSSTILSEQFSFISPSQIKFTNMFLSCVLI